MGLTDIDPMIVNSITAVASTVVGAVLGLLGALWVQKKGRVAQERAKHLDELKSQVFEPMLAHLTDEVVPILEHRLGNVGICEARVERPNTSVMESSIEIKQTFCYQAVSENVASVLQHTEEGPQLPSFFGSPLFRHTRQHFPDLFDAWDLLMREFGDYSAACIRYAEWLRSACAGAIPLPEYEDIQQRHWTKTFNVALVALYRQLGIWMFPPYRRTESDLEVLEYAGATLIRGSAEEVQQCITLLDELIGRRSQVERLVAQAVPVRDRALQVKAKIEDHLHRRRLPRPRCEYIA